MRVQTYIHKGVGSQPMPPALLADANLVLAFISPDFGPKEALLHSLQQAYPVARIVTATTGGEIFGDRAYEKAAVVSALKLEHAQMKIAQTNVKFYAPSYDAGCELGDQLEAHDLKAVFILSDGLLVNGTDLVRGIVERVGPDVIVTGGLAGDGARFQQTGVGVDTIPYSGAVIAIGFYGAGFRVSYGSLGGWSKFGPERIITRSSGCMLYELDGRPALDVYEECMGEDAAKLPGSGLLYPLSIRPDKASEQDVVRTIIGVDRENKCLIYAGDVLQGYVAQLMRGSVDSLVDGAAQAGEFALSNFPSAEQRSDSLAILVSCIGRNLLMKQDVSTEVEVIHRLFGDIPLVGFYSYGEICHHHATGQCGLHNQTMTITLITEAR